MIKLLGICGSPRAGATEHVLNESLEKAAKYEEISVDEILLKNYKLPYCIHCDKCIREESRYCAHHDVNNKEIYEKFYEADAYLIASPVYLMNATGQLTSFFNLLRPVWNIMKEDPGYFWDKVGAAIAVGGTRHGGQETTINTIHGFYHTYGVHVVGGNHAYNGGTIWSKDNKKAGAKADNEGMNIVHNLIERLVLSSYQLQYGKKRYLEMKKKIMKK
ncbi:MAG: flavodoxin family protein [Halanaerobiales bacterium]|nr:flavodoxin family protein [Halanaerobiales bacterium]